MERRSRAELNVLVSTDKKRKAVIGGCWHMAGVLFLVAHMLGCSRAWVWVSSELRQSSEHHGISLYIFCLGGDSLRASGKFLFSGCVELL